MKKLVALLLVVSLMLGMAVFAHAEEPVKLTLWTFQELHTGQAEDRYRLPGVPL